MTIAITSASEPMTGSMNEATTSATSELVTERANQILHHVFGYKSFRNQQQTIIESVVNGQDCLVVIPTGGGKSLCYQIPALLLSGTTIVISPLIALMKDQIDQLDSYGIKAACLNSLQTGEEQQQVINQYYLGEIKLLYIAPERLATMTFMTMIERVKPALIAIDEAHCISQWGHDFRPEYLQIGQLKKRFVQTPMIALTATADEVTRNDITQLLHLHNPLIHISSFDRPNIRYTVVETFNLIEQISSFLKSQNGNSGIIYCSSRAKVEDITASLVSRGFLAVAYHAGLSGMERSNAQDRFLKDDVQIIVATIAFGMGINKPNVRFVIHANAPRSIENYYQETGRAGRDGLPAEALLLFNQRDVTWYRKIIEEKEDDQQRSLDLHKLTEMIEFATGQTCRRITLLSYFGEHRLEKCNNCDICLYPPEHFDGLLDAQKILSCIYRIDQRFGAQYIVDVLRGANRANIKENGHEKLSVYGIGKEQSVDYWLSLIRQLIHLGYVKQNLGNYSTLYLAQEARMILRGEISLTLVKPRLVLVKRNRTNRDSRSNLATLLSFEERILFVNLKRLRKELAEQENVLPYIIFSDATLVEMAQMQPTSATELLNVSGVGNTKLEKYGRRFLAEIEKFISSH